MAMVVTVRPMAPADREHCAEFGVEVFEVIPPTVKTQEQITLNDTIGWREKKRASFMHEFATLPGCFVAETAAAGVVGFVTAGADTAALHGYISHLGVAEGSQGLGVGRTLLEAALDWMRQQPEGLRSAGIGAVATNWTGLHLYPSVGFLEVDRSVNYAMPLGPAAPVGAPARTQRQDDPQTRPQGPAIDLSTLSQHKLDMRMDTKAVLASAPPNGSIGANAHVNDNPAVKAMMEQRQAVAAAAGALDVALYRLGPESQVAEGVPRGRIVPHMQWAESTVFPETTRDWWIYVPDQYRPNDSQPARLMVFLDGQGYLDPEGHVRATTVLDNLIAAGDLPPTLGLFVTPGLRIGHSHVTDRRDMSEGLASLGWSGQADQRQRSFEYDSLTDLLPRFLLEDLLPVIEKEYRISPRGADRAVVGMSSGGIGAFNCAWHFPECFGRVISMCGSFTNIRGGHNYPWIVRNTVPAKPIHKVWLQSGENDLNNAHGSWPLANQELSLALEWAGYSHQLHIGKGTHSIRHGGSVFPDTCRWIWTDDDARGASAQPCL